MLWQKTQDFGNSSVGGNVCEKNENVVGDLKFKRKGDRIWCREMTAFLTAGRPIMA
jgi:hypothetical protein